MSLERSQATQVSWLHNRLVAVGLWLSVTGSALATVWVTSETRTLTTELLNLRSEAHSMQVAYGQFVLQERALSSAAELETVAQNQLQLRFPLASDIEVLWP